MHSWSSSILASWFSTINVTLFVWVFYLISILDWRGNFSVFKTIKLSHPAFKTLNCIELKSCQKTRVIIYLAHECYDLSASQRGQVQCHSEGRHISLPAVVEWSVGADNCLWVADFSSCNPLQSLHNLWWQECVSDAEAVTHWACSKPWNSCSGLVSMGKLSCVGLFPCRNISL